MNLNSKKIIIAINGGIAVYKVCDLTRLLVKAGAEVRIVMSDSAKQFVSPLTFETLSNHEVAHQMFDQNQFRSTKHIDWADWADLMLFAPATANLIGKLANGIYDDLLTTIASAFTGPKLIAPAMNSNMWNNSIVQENITKLAKHNYSILPTGVGDLACGWVGEGRLIDNKIILKNIKKSLTDQHLAGKRVLISSGPTYEDIDPVRFLGNRSSGKMGHALAEAAWMMGADTSIVSGPVSLEKPYGITYYGIRSANDMYRRITEEFPKNDIYISAAAIADFTIKNPSSSKIKKDRDAPKIDLENTKDVLSSIKKRDDQILVGFALETDNIKENAIKKLKNKNLDFIVLNDANDRSITFESDDNQVTIINKKNEETRFDKMPKEELAYKILNCIINK
jgi:phosphopantothenoylcysteine decarboxylase / phosphopantothenate---cysteine ligase